MLFMLSFEMQQVGFGRCKAMKYIALGTSIEVTNFFINRIYACVSVSLLCLRCLYIVNGF